MKAMILAAGVGSRLRPLTDRVPKALVEVGGVPMIERVIGRLASAGVTDLVVNLFHLGDRVVEFLASRGDFGLRIQFTREAELLDTGGGLKNAAWFFDDGRPFFLHNVDVVSEIDLGGALAIPRASTTAGDAGGAVSAELTPALVRQKRPTRRPGNVGGRGVGARAGGSRRAAGIHRHPRR